MKKIIAVLLALVVFLPTADVLAEGCTGPFGCVAKTRGVTVTTSATQLDTQPQGRDLICLWNNGSATLYYGFSTALTTANGLPLLAGGGPVCYSYGSYVAIYGIVASGTLDVRVLEQGGLGRAAGAAGVVR